MICKDKHGYLHNTQIEQWMNDGTIFTLDLKDFL